MIPICVRCAHNAATFTARGPNGSWDAICAPCTTLSDRWFSGIYPAGIVYADRAIEIDHDYKRVAFLPFATLELEIADPASPLLERVKTDAAAMEARRGEHFRVSTCGQTVLLGASQ